MLDDPVFAAEEKEKLAETLRRGQHVGIVGGDVADHIAHAMAFSSVVQSLLERNTIDALGAAFCVDLGSGAGLPGLPLALALPHTTWLLTEARGTRVTFLERAIRRHGLGSRVTVWPDSVQPAAHKLEWREHAAIVTARSFGPPAMTAECATGFLRQGGALVVSEPSGSDTAERWPATGLAPLGLTFAGLQAEGGHTFAVLMKTAGSDGATPRRRATMERQPAY